MSDADLSHEVLGCAYRVHTSVGSGLLEKVYQQCLVYELRKTGFNVKADYPVDIVYEGLLIPEAFRADIIVEDRLVLELKVVEKIHDNHIAQALTYLKFTKIKYGLIINFMESSLKNGVKRVAR